ncbi:CaiB/BaiF CoA-transferase family protein [Mangrovicoccus sp. HB161399]|uniref:CaiB/BaiF CoA transferase family protein n=1 Tax=Mangrovicoccus sp. HB161399 TaxID=2720392 RepID=UPI00155365ED|nr:CoA transferase [Mangrovicoccus sp. HB161399]
MQPFRGVMVLDVTHVLAGPFATVQLAMQGASVIKVEPPGDPDQSRFAGADPALNAEGLGTAFQTQGAGKRCLALDLNTEQGRTVLLQLAERADVFVENFRPGALAGLGLGAADLRRRNPRLIHCAISAFGAEGPRGQETAYDLVVQAATGLMAMNGTPETSPVRLGIPAVDYATGMMAAYAISAALFRRERTGEGAQIDLAMADVAGLLMASGLTGFANGGAEPRATGHALPGVAQGMFRAKDGPVAIAANNLRQQQRLFAALGRPDLVRETREEAARHRDADRAQLEQMVAERSAADLEDLLRAARVPVSPVRSVAEAMADPQRRARGSFARPETGGPLLPLSGFLIDGQPARHAFAPRKAGADSAEILAELGYSEAEIAALAAGGVI